jgi:hypothetical protein
MRSNSATASSTALVGDRCAGDGGPCGNYIGRVEKIIWRQDGRQLRHTYEEMPPEKRPQDVRYEDKRGGPVLSRRDGAGLAFTALEHPGLDSCPEVLVVRDQFRGKAVYKVQEPLQRNVACRCTSHPKSRLHRKRSSPFSMDSFILRSRRHLSWADAPRQNRGFWTIRCPSRRSSTPSKTHGT